MEPNEIKKYCPCCVCSGKLDDCVNAVEMDIKVPWKFPTCGNIIRGTSGLGMAFVCDKCFDLLHSADSKIKIKYVVEFIENECRLHELNYNEDGLIEGLKN